MIMKGVILMHSMGEKELNAQIIAHVQPDKCVWMDFVKTTMRNTIMD
jgi:hypothetical protein